MSALLAAAATTSGGNYAVIDRALSALEVLSRNMDGLSVTELAEQLNIPASSTHRILTSLKGNHLVVQDAQTKISSGI